MDWMYIAGFFDGEGNINVTKNKKKNSFYIQLRIYSSNRHVLEEIRNFIGIGNIYDRDRAINRKIVSELLISKEVEVFNFLKNIQEKCIIKRELINFILSNFKFGYDSNKDFDIIKVREFNKRGR